MMLRPTRPDDLDFVLAAEQDPEARRWILPWPPERHLAAIDDPDQSHLVVDDGEPVGFVLLAGLGSEHRSVELRRIVVTRRGDGLGRRALDAVLDHAFGDLRAHRVWLDVKTDNARARHVYAKAGFVEEGVLRDALLGPDGYESLVVMSMLATERR